MKRPVTLIDENGRVCTKCHVYKEWDCYYRHSTSTCGYRPSCKECWGKLPNRDWKSLKRAVMKAYGGECACCGETILAFLTIDHVNNDGAEHRRATGDRNGCNLYPWLRKKGYPKDGFQVLCWNCNAGKYINGGICPHESSIPD